MRKRIIIVLAFVVGTGIVNAQESKKNPPCKGRVYQQKVSREIFSFYAGSGEAEPLCLVLLRPQLQRAGQPCCNHLPGRR